MGRVQSNMEADEKLEADEAAWGMKGPWVLRKIAQKVKQQLSSQVQVFT